MKKYRAKEGETIWTISNTLYGAVSFAYKIAKDNNVGINDDLQGKEIEYDETIISTVLQPFNQSNIQLNTNQIYYGLSNQTIFDIQLQLGGISIVDLIKNSSLVNINQDVTGEGFLYQAKNNAITKYISLTKRVFANKPKTKLSREHDDSFERSSYS